MLHFIFFVFLCTSFLIQPAPERNSTIQLIPTNQTVTLDAGCYNKNLSELNWTTITNFISVLIAAVSSGELILAQLPRYKWLQQPHIQVPAVIACPLSFLVLFFTSMANMRGVEQIEQCKIK